MSRKKQIVLLLLSVIIGTLFTAAHKALADTLGGITEYPTSSSTEPHGIVEGEDGNLWFTEEGTTIHSIAKMTKSGSVTTYALPQYYLPNHITQGPNGNMWFTTSSNPRIGQITPSGTITLYTLPTGDTPGGGVITGPDGNMWAATWNYDGTTQSSMLRVLSPSGAFITSYSIATGVPVDLTTDYNNRLIWYAEREYYTNGQPTGRQIIGKISMDGTKTEYIAPSGTPNLNGITLGPDGNTWFSGGNVIGKVTPSGTFTSYTLPTTLSGAWDIRTGMDGYLWATEALNSKIARISTSGSITEYSVTASSRPLGLAMGTGGDMWFTEYNTGKIGKIGNGVTDADSDGLSASQESAQGTSDSNTDSDSDGLSDLIESSYYNKRNLVFCNASATTCDYPDPTTKDIYVETDWMVKPGTDGYSMQPSSGQIDFIETAFSTHGINAHFDTGQLGGGNQVPYNAPIYFIPASGLVDFYDYKDGGDGISSQFNSNRYHIFHYMLLGYNYHYSPGSSGVSHPGDDDAFVSYGLVKDTFTYSSLDYAISGTMIHELGHNLCLTDYNGGLPVYTGQPASCRYDGIDNQNNPYTLYSSAMNYTYQLDTTDYSTGVNGSPDDHDDWSALRLQDFLNSNTGDSSHGFAQKKSGDNRKPIYEHLNSRLTMIRKNIIKPTNSNN